jgi:hypothetical protein
MAKRIACCSALATPSAFNPRTIKSSLTAEMAGLREYGPVKRWPEITIAVGKALESQPRAVVPEA